MFVNKIHLQMIIHMIPREEDLLASREGFAPGYGIGGPQRGTPFAARVEMFMSPLSIPCIKPPYGEIAVVDLTTQQIVWRRGMGAFALGFPSFAGSIITASGLIFNAGVSDGQLRAMDVLNGDVIWQGDLPGASGATPMSYVSPQTGRQYVLVTVPGEGTPQGSPGDRGEGTEQTGGRVIAYALPLAADP